jgi:hypothetical protein
LPSITAHIGGYLRAVSVGESRPATNAPDVPERPLADARPGDLLARYLLARVAK